MSKTQRKQLLINRDLQGMLIFRTIGYWLACMMLILMPMAVIRTWNNPDVLIFRHLVDTFIENRSILGCAALLLPLAVYDMLKTSNRIAGPVFRLKRELARLADGESVSDVTFRPGDYWQDLADEFNRLAAGIQNGTSGNGTVRSQAASVAQLESDVTTSVSV